MNNWLVKTKNVINDNIKNKDLSRHLFFLEI